MPFADLREWVDAMERIDELKTFEDVDPEFEIGALTEMSAEAKGPALLFDKIKGYAPGYRVVSNLYRGRKRLLATLEMPIDLTPIQALQRWRRVIADFKPLPPVEVKSGPVLTHSMDGPNVDISIFPAPVWHELDGGRYIGTGDLVIVRDPDTGWINLGAYRIQNHDQATGGLFIQSVRHGYKIAQKYWAKGQACPVAVCLGQDPVVLLAAGDTVARTAEKVCEYDFAGYVRGKPIEVVPGRLTGFPVPATAEVVLEGEIPSPEEEKRPEGPFGEYLGYYAHGNLPEPILQSEVRQLPGQSHPGRQAAFEADFREPHRFAARASRVFGTGWSRRKSRVFRTCGRSPAPAVWPSRCARKTRATFEGWSALSAS